MAVRAGTGAIAPDLALDGLGAGTQEDPPGARAPPPRGGGQGGNDDPQDEDPDAEETALQAGSWPGSRSRGAWPERRRAPSTVNPSSSATSCAVFWLRAVVGAPLPEMSRCCRHASRSDSFFVHPESRGQDRSNVGRVRVDRYEGEVTLDDEGADRVASAVSPATGRLRRVRRRAAICSSSITTYRIRLSMARRTSSIVFPPSSGGPPRPTARSTARRAPRRAATSSPPHSSLLARMKLVWFGSSFVVPADRRRSSPSNVTLPGGRYA